jgi:hypothetical protein
MKYIIIPNFKIDLLFFKIQVPHFKFTLKLPILSFINPFLKNQMNYFVNLL